MGQVAHWSKEHVCMSECRCSVRMCVCNVPQQVWWPTMTKCVVDMRMYMHML